MTRAVRRVAKRATSKGGATNFFADLDPLAPLVWDDMVCIKCHGRGMTIIPRTDGKCGAPAYCHAAINAAIAKGAGVEELFGAECPKPWHCRRCKVGDVPHHAKWCDGKAGWCAPGECSICDDLRAEARP